MPDNNTAHSAAIQKLIERLMRQLATSGAMIHAARERCRDQYRRNEPEPRNRLRIMIDGLMSMLGEAVGTPINNVTENSSYQISVSASFIRTHSLACDLILNGDVIEAFVLVRKQLESLARLNELDSKPLTKLQGKTPNIQNALKGGAGRIYGNLSEIAHFSTPRVGELLEIIEKGDLTGPSLLPVYSERAVGCMDLCQFVAIFFEQWMVVKLEEWYPTMDTSDLRNAFVLVVETALEAGVIHEEKSGP